MNFSIRQMLLAMIGFALVSAIIAAGVNGNSLAYGIGISICMLVIYFLCFALLQGFALLIAPKHAKAPLTIDAQSTPTQSAPESKQ